MSPKELGLMSKMFAQAFDIGCELYATAARRATNDLKSAVEMSVKAVRMAHRRGDFFHRPLTTGDLLGFPNMATKGKYVYDWPRPMVTVDAAVFSFAGAKARLLLINRKHEPYQSQWAFPGGFIEMDEELEDAVARELEEETGLKGIALEQMRTFGTVGRDPRGRQITVVFMGIAGKGQTEVCGGDDAADARWFDIDCLPENMAFDHDAVARLAIAQLKRKKAYRQALALDRK